MLQTVAYGMLWKGHDSKHQKIQNAFFVGIVAQEKKKKTLRPGCGRDSDSGQAAGNGNKKQTLANHSQLKSYPNNIGFAGTINMWQGEEQECGLQLICSAARACITISEAIHFENKSLS